MRPITDYGLFEFAWPFRLRGPGNSQHPTNGLIYPGPTYHQMQVGGALIDTANPVVAGPGIAMGYFSMHNRSGTTTFAGMAVRIPNAKWVAGTWVAATTTYVDATPSAQSATTNDFPLEAAATTAGNGFVIASEVYFNAVSIDVAAGNGGAGATRVQFQSNQAGTAWTTVSANAVYVTLPAVTLVTGTTAANEGLIVWEPPPDWGRVTVSTNANWTGMPLNMYAMSLQSTTQPTAAASANSLSIYRVYWTTEALADNGTFEWNGGAMEAWMEPSGDALVPLFSSSDPGNRVTVLARARG